MHHSPMILNRKGVTSISWQTTGGKKIPGRWRAVRCNRVKDPEQSFYKLPNKKNRVEAIRCDVNCAILTLGIPTVYRHTLEVEAN